MGLLALGTPLEWEEAKTKADHVREWGILQLLALWKRNKNKDQDALKWGDEVEYLVVAFDDEAKKVRLSLRQADILAALARDEALQAQRQGEGQGKEIDDDGSAGAATGSATVTTTALADFSRALSGPDDKLPIFHPEFGRFMLESTPGRPWGIGFKDLLRVEPNMRLRRVIAKEHMRSSEYPVTLTTFPRLGSKGDFITPYYPPSGERLRSQFVPDEIANPHIRFPTLAANIRSRRGRKVEVNVPIFKDSKTPSPWLDPTVNYDLHQWPEDGDVRQGAVKEDHIYMDAMAFGMGSCCLQITFQAKNITEGRTLYDQMSPLGPVLLALTAGTPIYKGFLADTDVRWNQICAAVDDRTAEELGEKELQQNRWQLPKSRYAANSTYIAQDPRLRPEYFDPTLVIDERIKQTLVDGGMDDLLATHFSHLFIRDPIVIFSEDLKELDLSGADHFENLQSTNWQHMRFKPPPADKEIGWRVEFRSMEVQITDFENAAFSIFIVLVTRAVLSFDLNFYLPIQRTTENMQTAHRRDAVLSEAFYFRKDPFTARHHHHHHQHAHPRHDGSTAAANGTASAGTANPSRPPTPLGPVEDEYELMTVDEIVNGKENGFPGLIPLVESYLDSVNVDVETRCELARYLDLIRRRANGQLWTAAKWIRHFVQSHEKYQHDSIVDETISYDLIKAVQNITESNGKGNGTGSQMFRA